VGVRGLLGLSLMRLDYLAILEWPAMTGPA
jgi:hypothetical protein